MNVFLLVFVLFVCLTDKIFWFSGEPTKPEKYGYRKGSEEEARNGKLTQTMNRVSAVAEGISSGTVSKGWKKQVTQAAEVAKGSAGKAEFLEKHIHKQQQEIEDLKKLVTGLSNAAAPPSPSQSQSQVCFALLFFISQV